MQAARAAQAAQAAPATVGAPAGIVKRSVGKVTLERAGQTIVVQPGQVLQVGDTLRSGPASAAGITLRDDTLLTTGPDSQLQITSVAFDALTQDGNLLASLWRGTLAVVTGLISKRTPDNIKVQTRTVVLGARGTEFIVDSSGPAPGRTTGKCLCCAVLCAAWRAGPHGARQGWAWLLPQC